MHRRAAFAAPILLALLAPGPVLAQVVQLDPDALKSQFETSGWEAVTAEQEGDEIEIEARRAAMTIEVVYDRTTGMVRHLEIDNADGRPVMIPGMTLTPAG